MEQNKAIAQSVAKKKKKKLIWKALLMIWLNLLVVVVLYEFVCLKELVLIKKKETDSHILFVLSSNFIGRQILIFM